VAQGHELMPNRTEFRVTQPKPAEEVAVSPPPAVVAGLAPTPSAAEPDLSLGRLPDEVQSVFEYAPATMGGYLAGVIVIGSLFWEPSPPWLLISWISAVALIVLARISLERLFWRKPPQTLADWQFFRRWWNAGTLTGAVLWGAMAWIFYSYGDGTQRTALIVVVYTFCVAAVPVLANQPTVYMAYGTFAFVPMAVRIVLDGSDDSWKLAGVLMVILVLTTILARNYRQALQRAIDLKHQADHLLVQLRREKDAAELARREAEVANRAKTQFFTAASHDLRQPLHAMGLFAEALRQRNHDEEVAHLVNSINGSVDALEGLFSELLDITRIDTGGVDVNPQHFEVGDIFRKLRLHFEPTAFEKGLSLRLHGGRHVAHADPLLVERVLRNLLSNAIRYTNDGGVLVSCRRRGDVLRLQVWDTGLGIREVEQQRIFEEFYQVPNNGGLTPTQRKGLGLGLAIVKRLAGLMEAPLSLCSEAGRGSVFTLELPIGKRARPQATVPAGKAQLGITLEGRTIVVVEDEPAVLAGLEVLLKGWGARLICFDSVGACTTWASRADPVLDHPDLLIVDYRLENGRNGVDAIVALRETFEDQIPAIIVTGSTMTGHDLEAQEKDFHLLIKPVVPNKLRAMIAFKLGSVPRR